ncbi:MAG: AMP-binding protein, partial [Thalassovita sp.]
PGQIGELVHRGPNVMFGYYKNPEATAEARKFGWHHTGDLGLITEDGEFQFLDRKKDMIKTGGENVSTIQVEEQLLACPEVEAAIAVGLPHPRWGEAVTAFVVARDKAAQDPTPIMDRITAHLSGFQMPKKIVFVDSVPTTATGKLRKVELRQQYQDLYAAE